MTQATGDHISSFAANSVGMAIQIERKKIADYLRQKADILGALQLQSDGRAALLIVSDAIQSGNYNSERRNDENFADPDCPGCGGGDKVPHGKYFRCPVCDSEWQEETEDQPTQHNTHGEQD